MKKGVQESIKKVLYCLSLDFSRVHDLGRYHYPLETSDLDGIPRELLRIMKEYEAKGLKRLTSEMIKRENLNEKAVKDYFEGLTSAELDNLPLYLEDLASKKAYSQLVRTTKKLNEIHTLEDNKNFAENVESLMKLAQDEMLKLKPIKKTKEYYTAYDLNKQFATLTTEKNLIPTGLDEIDKVIKGISRKDITLLTGLSNQGKTTTAIQIIVNILIKQGLKVAFINAELTPLEMYGKVMGLITGEGYQAHNQQNYNENNKKRHNEKVESGFYYIDKYIQDRLIVKCGDFNEEELMQEVLECERMGVDIIFMDYFQLVEPKDAEEETKAGAYKNMAERIRSLVKTQTNLAFVWLSQLKENKKESPMQMDISWCKDLYKGAALELRVYREFENVELQTFRDTIFMGFKKTRHSARVEPIEFAFNGETGSINQFALESIEEIKEEYERKGLSYNYNAYLEDDYTTDEHVKNLFINLTEEEIKEREEERKRKKQEELEDSLREAGIF